MAKSDQADHQSIEQLRDRYEDLNQQKIVFQTKRDTALEQLNKLKASALEQYGTDDVEQLRNKLAQMKKENEKLRSKYQQSLDQIESQLDEIQENFENETASSPGNG